MIVNDDFAGPPDLAKCGNRRSVAPAVDLDLFDQAGLPGAPYKEDLVARGLIDRSGQAPASPKAQVAIGGRDPVSPRG